MSQQVILITGASSGIGRCCAISLSKDYRLILAGSSEEKLRQTQSLCSDHFEHILWVCDFFTQRDFVFESLTLLLRENDVVVDKYIHFAGVTQILPIKDFSIPYVDRIFNINFFSIIEIIRALLKKANQKSLKNVILISALYSQRGNKGNSIYCASKGAINSLVYSLAQELAPAVRINALLPGAIETPMAQNVAEEHKMEIINDTPLGIGHADDVCNYVEFLFSDKSKWITGQTLFVDGGRSTK